jgi:hypothetical protein
MKHTRTLFTLALVGFTLIGCVQRRMYITSEPTGARVTVNDVEVGTTPVEVDFTFYGDYDILVVKEGCEPLREIRPVKAPVWQIPPFDLAAEAVPGRTRHEVKLHFILQPALESSQNKDEFEAALIERAKSASQQAAPQQPDR